MNESPNRKRLDSQVQEAELAHKKAAAMVAELEKRIQAAEHNATLNKDSLEFTQKNDYLSPAERAAHVDSLATRGFQLNTAINTYKQELTRAKAAAQATEKALREAQDARAKELDAFEREEFVEDYVRRGGSRAEAVDLWPEVKAKRMIDRLQAEDAAQAQRTREFYRNVW